MINMKNNMRILVVGDIILDRYIKVTSDRMAPESNIKVWDKYYDYYKLGGAANVANNIKTLDKNINVFLCGIVASEHRKLIEKSGINVSFCVGNETMQKDRFVHGDKYVFRYDNFKKFTILSVECLCERFEKFIKSQRFDAIVFSDYDKGTIKDSIINNIKNYSCLTVVDSKRLNLSMYRGMDLLKLNELEYSRQISHAPYDSVESLFRNVVVTKGKHGAQLRILNNNVDEDCKGVIKRIYKIDTEDFLVKEEKVKDVTGCGDTHTAAMTVSLLKEKDIRLAIKFANVCAGKVVVKFGTCTI